MFEDHNGYQQMFKEKHLSFGLTLPLENYHKETPTMTYQIERAQLAEKLGFECLWFQDVLLEDPTFEDPATGQIFDSLIYLTHIASLTESIKLGTAALVTPLRHPLRLAKEIASIERLFPERIMMGVSSGDRRKDFEGLGIPIMERGAWFRDSFSYFKRVLYEEFPDFESSLGKINRSNLVPKPTQPIPILMTGYCQQTLEWIAEHGDGWMFYPQRPEKQQKTIQQYRDQVHHGKGESFHPFLMPLPLELSDDPNYPAEKIPAGYRTGRNHLIEILEQYRSIGVNHIMFGLSKNKRPVPEVMQELGEDVLPRFSI